MARAVRALGELAMRNVWLPLGGGKVLRGSEAVCLVDTDLESGVKRVLISLRSICAG